MNQITQGSDQKIETSWKRNGVNLTTFLAL